MIDCFFWLFFLIEFISHLCHELATNLRQEYSVFNRVKHNSRCQLVQIVFFCVVNEKRIIESDQLLCSAESSSWRDNLVE